jgi:hypothetical protein
MVVYVCMYVCMYACMYACVCVCVCMCAYKRLGVQLFEGLCVDDKDHHDDDGFGMHLWNVCLPVCGCRGLQ